MNVSSAQVLEGWEPEDSITLAYLRYNDIPSLVIVRVRDGQPSRPIAMSRPIPLADLRKGNRYHYQVARFEELDAQDELNIKLREFRESLKPRRDRNAQQVAYDYVGDLPVVLRFQTRSGEFDFRMSAREEQSFQRRLDLFYQEYDAGNLRSYQDAPSERPVITEPKGRSIGTLHDAMKAVSDDDDA